MATPAPAGAAAVAAPAAGSPSKPPVLNLDEKGHERRPSVDENICDIQINHVRCRVPTGTTIIEACRMNNVKVPTLCDHPRLKPAGKCRVCVVNIEGDEDMPFKLACCTKVKQGMSIRTDTPMVHARANTALQSFLGVLRKKIDPTAQSGEIEELVNWGKKATVDDVSDGIYRDMSLCVGCTRCIRACNDVQGMNILEKSAAQGQPVVTANGLSLKETACITCGQCAVFCPTGAITEKDDIWKVKEAMAHGKVVVLQVAPSIRVAIGESFGLPTGSVATGKIVSAAKALGFHYVFDTSFGADMTIMEEASELLETVKSGGPFPMFTSCCPGWINLAEQQRYSYVTKQLSTCRSPMMMMGATIKTQWAQQMKIDPKNIYSVALMPCTAKKDEIQRKLLQRDGQMDVDCVLTTREFVRFVEQKGLAGAFKEMPDLGFDNPLGQHGPGVLFGVTGGVCEAALRTAYEFQTGKPAPKIVFSECRGLDGMKEVSVDMGEGLVVKAAIINGSKNAIKFIERMKGKGKLPYHFVEIMACPGGCIGGGGQPRSNDPDVLKKRAAPLYNLDESNTVRRSHMNPDIIKLYKEFFDKPLSEKAHQLLHCTFKGRPNAPHVKNVQGGVHRVPSMNTPRFLAVQQQMPVGADGPFSPNHGAEEHEHEHEEHEEAHSPAKKEASSGSSLQQKGILILYGSQGGTAMSAAKGLEADCRNKLKKIPVRCQSMDSYPVADLPKEKLVLFVTCTFGDGEFPDNAKSFWESLSDPELPNDWAEQVQFAVAGLGNSQYGKEGFVRAARLLDARMASLGGKRIVPLATGDENTPEKYHGAFNPWAAAFFSQMGGSKDSENEPKPPIFTVTTAGLSKNRPFNKRLAPRGYHFAKMTKSAVLTPASYDRPIRLIEFDLEGSGLTYETGGHAGILPRNDPKAVQSFLDFCKLDGDAMINVAPVYTNTDNHSVIPPVLSVRELFEQYIDLYAPVTRSFITELSLIASDEKERKALVELAASKDFQSFCQENTYEDAMRAFPSALPPIESIISMVPEIKPRLYSIASSASVLPNKLELLIVKVEWDTPKHKHRKGLCTDYLFRMNPEEQPKIPFILKSGILHPPEDPKAPLVMVGLGTGIAAFRAFLFERLFQKKQGVQLGPCVLYMGVRFRKLDYVLDNEWQMFVKEGVLDKCNVAFSRDNCGGPTMHVQKLMFNTPTDVWQVVQHDGSHIYYCGSANGIPEQVMKGVEAAISKEGKMDAKRTARFLQKFMDPAKPRYHCECYQTVLPSECRVRNSY